MKPILRRRLINSTLGLMLVFVGSLEAGDAVVYYKDLPVVDPWVPYAMIIIGLIMLGVVWLSKDKAE